MYLVRPTIEHDESLTSYLIRLGKENGYPKLGEMFDVNRKTGKAFTWTDFYRNTFSNGFLRTLSVMTGIPIPEITRLTFNGLKQRIGIESFRQLTYRNAMQFCPLCLREKFMIKREWTFQPISMCSIHHIELVRQCIHCGRKITVRDLYNERCTCCGWVIREGGPEKNFEKVTTECKLHLNAIISEKEEYKIDSGGTSYKLREFLFLAERSFFLTRGLGLLTENSKLVNLNEQVSTQFTNLIWMYRDFPVNFIPTLEMFHLKRRSFERYIERREFEYLFNGDLFPEIKDEYFKFWNKFDRKIRTPVLLSAKYISKSKAAKILGIHAKFITPLLREGVIKGINPENLLNGQEVKKLRDQCTGVLSENREGRITIRDLLYKYRYKDLNIVDLMSFIVHGFLHPEKTKNTHSIMDSTLIEKELINCLQLFQYKQPNKNEEVEAMRNNDVQLGMATITAKGLIHLGRIYSNPAMIKHQWFEYAEKFGEWQCPIGYFPENPEHIVLFDAQSLEVATSIENQQHPDADVLEAYYYAINRLKERLSEAKVKQKKE